MVLHHEPNNIVEVQPFTLVPDSIVVKWRVAAY